MIHTYEQKLIWTDFQGMTTIGKLIGKLEKNLIKKKNPVFQVTRINPVLI